MYHRTIFLKYRQGVSQAEASEMLGAFQALTGRVEGLAGVSVDTLRDEHDVSIDLAFATREARDDSVLDGFYQAAWTWARELCAALECRESTDSQPAQAGEELPLRWHKFLVCFALWFMALVNMFEALGLLCGRHLTVGDYGPYIAFLVLEILAALSLFAIAILRFFACWALGHFSRRGPRLAVGVYAATLILNIIVPIIAQYTTNMPLDDAQAADARMSIIAYALLTAGNYVYYRRRAALFVN